MLQGVLERGTAASLRRLAPYVGGKTGTTDNENDAWFVGFTNDVTIAVWVGYDNADGKRRTLGRGQTGAKVAIPIFERILEAAWAHHAPKTPLAPPSPEAARQLIALPIDLRSGDRLTDGAGAASPSISGSTASDGWRRRSTASCREDEVYAFSKPDPWSDGEAAGGLSGSRRRLTAAAAGLPLQPRSRARRARRCPSPAALRRQPWWDGDAPIDAGRGGRSATTRWSNGPIY